MFLRTNVLAWKVDDYSRPIGYYLAIGSTVCSRVRYGYDAEGRIATFAATNAANRGFQVTYLNESGYNYGYTLTTPNGATLTRTVTRDPFRRSLTLDCTTRFNNVVVASFAYTFDAHSRPVARNNDRFAYNDRDEITSALIGTNRINRAYDTIGNHTQCIRNGIEYLYANNELNQTTQETVNQPGASDADGDGTPSLPVTNTFTWLAQGGLQRDGRFVYAFDAEDQLTSVTSSHLTNGAIRVVNAYDYRRRRISKTVYRCVVNTVQVPAGSPPSPATTTMWNVQERHDFVYDDWNLVHETVTAVDANSTTNITEIEYFWGPDLSNTLQGAGGIGGLLAVSRNGQFYFPVYDNNGNIVKYIGENGAIVATYNYDDFGRILSSFGSMSDIFAIRFSTKYFDSETCLCYYGYRFYLSKLCSWANRDPLGGGGGENLYSFVDNSPASFTDAYGLHTFCFNDVGWKYADVLSGRLRDPTGKPIATRIGVSGVLLEIGSSCRREGGKYYPLYKFKVSVYALIQNKNDAVWEDKKYGERVQDPRVKNKWNSFWFSVVEKRINLVLEHEERHKKHARKNYDVIVKSLERVARAYTSKDVCESCAKTAVNVAADHFWRKDNEDTAKVDKGEL